jgi:diguanylate cyclase (GGDEF)-like protein/PAS domain S-box-containing protein
MSRPLRVLLIEDEPNDAELLVRKLRSGGFVPSAERVDRLEDVREALEREEWDVVLCDHSMPGFRSADVLVMLRERVQTTPLIVVSGAIGEQEVVDALHLGAASYVDKNSLSRLVPMIERALQDAELRRAHQRTQRELELVRAAVDSANDLILILETLEDEPASILYVNGAAERITGYTAAELMERGLGTLYGPDTDSSALGQGQISLTRGGAATVECKMYRKDGSAMWVETVIEPIASGSSQFISVSRDITDRKNAEEKVAFLATHDPLTGLANRTLLDERIDGYLARARRTGTHVGVLVIDLDGFKAVNDSHGHEIGDRLLREIAHRLTCSVREVDTVARLGGDEFVVVLGDAIALEPIVRAAERILESASAPITLDDKRCHVSISIGVAVYPNDGETGSTLIKSADKAMYHVKGHGKNGFHFASVRAA